jgi:hypothetical protein
LDRRAQRRLYVLNHVLAGQLAAGEAATYLDLSVRIVRWLLARYRGAEGGAGLVHGNRGRVPATLLDEDLRARLVELVPRRLSRSSTGSTSRFCSPSAWGSLSRSAPCAGSSRRACRRCGGAGCAGHRLRRERMAQAGLLLQVDGSRHDRLAGRALVGAIDDATGAVTEATIREQEDTASYVEALVQTARAHGLPVGL